HTRHRVAQPLWRKESRVVPLPWRIRRCAAPVPYHDGRRAADPFIKTFPDMSSRLRRLSPSVFPVGLK
ncbi:hypothetical protein HAX54_036690, partial [Datura stramonium]|nr:hypothetical protein [Datura stramonium]